MKTKLQLSATEIEMANEVFGVLSKYKGKTRQFGLHLIHSHFPISKDEVLYETHNFHKRTLEIRPVKLKDFKEAPLATAWSKENGNLRVTMFCCDGPGVNDGPPTH